MIMYSFWSHPPTIQVSPRYNRQALHLSYQKWVGNPPYTLILKLSTFSKFYLPNNIVRKKFQQQVPYEILFSETHAYELIHAKEKCSRHAFITQAVPVSEAQRKEWRMIRNFVLKSFYLIQQPETWDRETCPCMGIQHGSTENKHSFYHRCSSLWNLGHNCINGVLLIILN